MKKTLIYHVYLSDDIETNLACKSKFYDFKEIIMRKIE